ncbi:MAG: hypothetical protein LBV15_04115 [Planctomycetota bacterium]|jgi:hypothetical protein|nr:hypothetical protein [Planctomycetota bacterium]
MAKREPVDIEALIKQGEPIKDAIRKGAREAMKRHIAGGVPMVSWKDGKVVEIPVEELARMLNDGEKS